MMAEVVYYMIISVHVVKMSQLQVCKGTEH